ncbi:type I-E CRISPR-associated protein Cse2/CasB, partial [Bacteroides heparinolyticus]|uniref:type I-E CRISPR-associated protein Cse2/CasB n=1 Tax=Prevotella heparinolytica TaxID=28113 RepID=UPI0035A091D8
NEKVAMTVLQLYAIYKQGNSDAIMAEDEATEKNMGYVFRSLRDEEDTIAIDNRFNTMLTSDSFDVVPHIK